MAAHQHDLAPFSHSHAFGLAGAQRRERALWQVALITLLAMAGELAVGYWSGSLALVADGWHMGTHALALGGSALASNLARRARHSSRYAFGGWKIEMLAAYTSALLLAGVCVSLLGQAVAGLIAPGAVAYEEAMVVAAVGLGVNLLCAWLLARAAPAAPAAPGQASTLAHGHGDDHGHDQGPHSAHAHAHSHDHGHTHGHHHGHHHAHGGDANFKAAMLHVVADALTSVLALAALAGGLWWGLRWLDPAVAVLGAVVIGRWAWAVLKDASRALVDASASLELARQAREALESDGDAKVADLHVWQVGPQAFAAVATVVADRPLPPAAYRERLQALSPLQHVTVEVNRCTSAA